MMINQPRLTYLLDRYVRKVITTAELDEFMQLVDNEDSQSHLEMLLDEFWEQSEEVPLKNQVSRRIFSKAIASESVVVKTLQTWPKAWMGWAAAVVLLVSAVFWFGKSTPKPAALVKQTVPVGLAEAKEQLLVVTTVNEHQKVTLPDGSTVILNDHSTIQYPEKFGTKREVRLVGEGYFDIKHLSDQAFIVHSGGVQTTVLGTAFNIKAYAKQAIQVTVTRGKVQVANQQTILGVLTPNQQVSFNPIKYKAKLATVNAKTIVQWQENDLFFDDVTMEDAAKVLAEKFSTPIVFANNNAKKCRFSATFLKGESLAEILKVICAFNNAQYQTSAAGITIQGDGC